MAVAVIETRSTLIQICILLRNILKIKANNSLHQKRANRNQIAPIAGICAQKADVCPVLPEPNIEAIIQEKDTGL